MLSHRLTVLLGFEQKQLPYLADLIELNRRRSLSYTEDSVSEDRENMA